MLYPATAALLVSVSTASSVSEIRHNEQHPLLAQTSHLAALALQVTTEARRGEEPLAGFSAGPYNVWRRFSDFEMLWKFLSEQQPQVSMA